MVAATGSGRIQRAQESLAPLLKFMFCSAYVHRQGAEGICDFVFGNPHDMPLEGFTAALHASLPPLHKDWFAYKQNDPGATATVAQQLQRQLAIQFEA
jgi:aspartate aminotransferase